MKKYILLFSLTVLICACNSTKTKYFDENGVEVSKEEFKSEVHSYEKFEIPGDSIHHKKLMTRAQNGYIDNREVLELLLEKATNRELDSDKPIVVMYYPGKDKCNSSGTATKKTLKIWHKDIEKGIKVIVDVTPVYIYKDAEGLGKYDGVVDWYKDPEGIIETTFFKHHYPCGSFVVISKDGEYVSGFGEYGHTKDYQATAQMTK